jgi:hypothetical protein
VDQALIDEIVAKVVTLVRAKMIANVPKKRVLMLFSGASTGYVVGMDTIRMLTQANHDLTVFMTASAIHVVGEENVLKAGAQEIITPKQWVNTPGLVRETDLLLVPTLSMNTAARLALGLMDSLFSTLVLGALLADKPIVAICDGADPYGNGGLIFSDDFIGSPALRAKMVQNLSTLIDYGIHLVEEEGFMPQVIRLMQAEALQAPSAPASPMVQVANGTILTESDLLCYPSGTTLAIPSHTRLTPLAQDHAQKHKLTLIFENHR